jgi:hypothetical protein
MQNSALGGASNARLPATVGDGVPGDRAVSRRVTEGRYPVRTAFRLSCPTRRLSPAAGARRRSQRGWGHRGGNLKGAGGARQTQQERADAACPSHQFRTIDMGSNRNDRLTSSNSAKPLRRIVGGPGMGNLHSLPGIDKDADGVDAANVFDLRPETRRRRIGERRECFHGRRGAFLGDLLDVGSPPLLG